MRTFVLLLLLTFGLARAALADEAQWIRYAAVSPDGERVAFAYAGDLWTVPIEGGDARPLTTHVGYEKTPVWAPDSGSIAFAADWHGNFDVYVVSADGGKARRLTWHSGDDVPTDFRPDGEAVLFHGRRLDAPEAALGTTFFPELYTVPVAGGRPRQLLTTPALAARYRPDGKAIVYEDLKGYENAWRKHHTSSVTRDLWLWDLETGQHRRLTKSRAEDRNPVWAPHGRAVLFLSERSGSFCVWRLGPDQGREPRLVADLPPEPIRFLSVARDLTVVFTWRGSLHRMRGDAEPVQIPVHVTPGDRVNTTREETFRKGATEFVPSPNGKEVAFVVRGEVFVASVEHGTTKRVTETPEQERSVTWAPDGRTLYYASERDASWNLYATTMVHADEKFFFRSTALRETPVLVNDHETFQPVCSPDGKQLAYVLDRDAIAVLELEGRESRTLVPAEHNYSYVDGDIEFEWSPDSRWLAFTMHEEGRWIGGVGVVDVAKAELVNVTRSGYEEGQPRWSPDGTVLLFGSNRHGRRSHASWGSEGDVIGLYLTQDAFDRARLSKEEYDLLPKKDKKKQEAEGAPPVEIDFEDVEERIRRLTIHSAQLGDHRMTPDGERLVYTAKVGDAWGLWVNKVRESNTRRVLSLGKERPGELFLAKDGKTAFVRRGGGAIVKVGIGGGGGGKGSHRRPQDEEERGGEDEGGGGGGRGDRVEYAARMTIDETAEREHLFEHVWRQTQAKFYDPQLHGVDWDALKTEYAGYLPHVRNGRDFAELLSEMLGELNASHTGARYRPRESSGAQTAALGLLYDTTWRRAGLRVAEVLTRGPAERAGLKINAGDVILRIDGRTLTQDVNPWALLDRKEGKPLRLGLGDAESGETWEVVVRPISLRAESNLLYDRWVRQREALTTTLSSGRVGYVHVRGMGDGSFRRIFRDALGKHGAKEALVVDTRFNGGGWMHDDLVSFLGGEDYAFFVPRGKTKGVLGAEPHQRWSRPVAVIQNEGNYSDAHFFPYAFQALGLGKLVGTPVAGTATAVWWERLMDPALVFGIPQVGMVTPEGKYLENLELQPDVEVRPTPEQLARGDDPQLAAAVRVLLDEADAK